MSAKNLIAGDLGIFVQDFGIPCSLLRNGEPYASTLAILTNQTSPMGLGVEGRDINIMVQSKHAPDIRHRDTVVLTDDGQTDTYLVAGTEPMDDGKFTLVQLKEQQ